MTEMVENSSDVELQLQHRVPTATSQIIKPPVVQVTEACKKYGSKRDPLIVLNGLNMTVPKGAIYGLLGASGCGKTTLLGCILGQRKLNSGKVWVLGGPPGSKSSGVPGPRVGYMPQEIGLYGDFTIRETFTYYGWVAGMSNKRINERFEMLKELFMLPSTNQRVKTLSGGEQRRLSFASVLLYEPELLILDEPTVGTDPLLRESIWSHLLHICKEANTTVIITTHYIEEAKQADVVGLMRGGVLLAEEPPEALLQRMETQTLGDAFLKLSTTQNTDSNSTILQDVANLPSTTSPTEHTEELSSNDTPTEIDETAGISKYLPSLKAKHMKALVWKNALWWLRNTVILIYTFLLIIFAIGTFCVCIGPDPRDLPVAVVNYETNNTDGCRSTLRCSDTQISCNYLEKLKEYSFIMIYYNSEEDARQSVIHGATYASIIIRQNYTVALHSRFEDMFDLESWNLESANIDIFLDGSNSVIKQYVKSRMYDTFNDFAHEYLRSCNISENLIKLPLQWKKPIYGVKYPSFTEFIIPGALLSLIFMLAVMLTSTALLIEKSEASLDKTLAIGITKTELLLAHIICEFIIMVLQSIFAIVSAFLIFGTTQNGSILLVVALTILVGLCGMCFGLFISCYCQTVLAASMFALGMFYPVMLLSGLVWPIEGMHPYLQWFILYLPLTAPIDGMRSILQRSWGLSEESVYNGFVFAGVWAVIFLILSLICIKRDKS